METKTFKHLPYGISDFRRIVTQNYAYVDKTRFIAENAFGKLSDYDLQRFDEKYIQILLLAYLFMSKIYIPMSEYETGPGRADIFLQRNPLLPEIKYEWILEIR
jgi:hypothetical protein